MGNQAYKNRHKEQGLCVSCSRLAVPGDYYCTLHRYTHQLTDMGYYWRNKEVRDAKVRMRREELKSEGKCPDCGVLLIEGEGVKCANCNFISRHPGITKGGFR